MRRNRIIFGILWILSLVGISFFGGAVSYGFFAMLTLVFLVSLLYVVMVHIFFRIYQELEENEPVAGQMVPFYFVLKNEYFFGFAGIRARFFTDYSHIAGLDDEAEYELLPRTGIEKRTELVCKYRGNYEVGIRSVEMQDYFRLFTISFRNKETLRVEVKPKIVHLEELSSVDISYIMARDSASRLSDPDVLVRKYEAGDDIRQIHWKTSARSGELMVRKRIGEEQDGIRILLETSRTDPAPEEYLPVENKMLEAALSLALFFAKKSIPMRMYFHGKGEEKVCERAVSMHSFGTLYEELSHVEFREETPEELFLETVSHVHDFFQSKMVFLILHRWSEETDRLFLQMQENNVYTVVFLVSGNEEDDALPVQAKNGKVIRISPDAELAEVM